MSARISCQAPANQAHDPAPVPVCRALWMAGLHQTPAAPATPRPSSSTAQAPIAHGPSAQSMRPSAHQDDGTSHVPLRLSKFPGPKKQNRPRASISGGPQTGQDLGTTDESWPPTANRRRLAVGRSGWPVTTNNRPVSASPGCLRSTAVLKGVKKGVRDANGYEPSRGRSLLHGQDMDKTQYGWPLAAGGC